MDEGRNDDEGGLFSDWNVIIIGMAAGAGLLAVVIVIVIGLTVCRKQRLRKQTNNYNCRSVYVSYFCCCCCHRSALIVFSQDAGMAF